MDSVKPHSSDDPTSRTRIGYLGSIIVIFFLVGGFFVSRSILSGFDQIEVQNVLGEVGWVMADLEEEGFELANVANDLAVLPEAAQFFASPSEAFFADYLDPVSAELLMFDFAALYDRSNQFLAGVRYDAGLADESRIAESASEVLKRRLKRYQLERDQAKLDLVILDGTVFFLASHLVYDLERDQGPDLGTIVLGKRLALDYRLYEGVLGTTYALPSSRDVSPWKGGGEPINQTDVYPVFPEEEFEIEEEPFDDGDWDELSAEEWEIHEFDVDLDVFEQSQFFLIEPSARGPDGQPKTQVMCALGGSYEEAEVVLKVLVPQTISQLAARKARLVNGVLWVGVVMTIGFTAFVVREIRRRFQAERSLRRANDQLEQANAQKDRLFSIIGHDLRAPLNGVIRLSELMVRAPESFASKDVSRFATNINQTGKQLHGLLENLLNWSRFQTGQLPFNPIVLDLATVVRQVAALYRPRAEEKGIRLEWDVAEGMTVRADTEMLNTVLRNLVSNAIKFTDAGGTVDLSVSELDGFVRISVADTGRGMSVAQVNRLFELRTDSADRSAPEEEQGSGFGLLLCQEMVRRHRSVLEVFSDPGVGSEFSFSIPTAQNTGWCDAGGGE